MPRMSEAFLRWLPARTRAFNRASGRLRGAVSEAPQNHASGRLAERESPGANIKGSTVGPLIMCQSVGMGEPVWAPRDYSALARDGFMQNAVVYRCVRMIAEAAASIPLLLYAGDEEIETHPLLDLLRRPSLDHTQTDFLEAWYGFLLVSGNAYVEAVALDGEVRELFILRPDRMKVIPGPDGFKKE